MRRGWLAAGVAVAGLAVGWMSSLPATARAEAWLPASDLTGLQGIGPSCSFLNNQPGVGGVDVAVDSKGNAVAAWTLRDAANNQVVQASFRPAGGSFGPPQSVGIAEACYFLGQLGTPPAVGIDDQGTAILAWPQTVGGNTVVQTSIRPPGASFGAPVAVSNGSQDASAPSLAVSRTGHAVVAWDRSDGANRVVQASTRSPGGGFQPPIDLSTSGQDGTDPHVAVNNQGAAAVTWTQDDLAVNSIVRARVRPPGSGFAPVRDLSGAGQNAADPNVAIDSQGRATVVWQRPDGTQNRIESRPLTPAGEIASGVDSLSDAGTDSQAPDVALDNENTAVAIWIGCPTAGGDCRIEGASRLSGGSFQDPQGISAPLEGATPPQVAMTPAGVAVAAWSRLSIGGKVQSARRPKGGTFGGVTDISPDGGIGLPAHLAVDDEGNTIAAWTFQHGAPDNRQVGQVAVLDAGPPLFTGLSVPTAATTGLTVNMSAAAVDRFSGASIGWEFGDATGAAGGSVAHAYSTPGDYTVTVTARDTAGNARSETRTVRVSNPTAPPPTSRIRGVRLSLRAKASRRFTRLTRLQVKGVPGGSTVRAACTIRRRKCPGKARRPFSKRKARGTVNLRTRYVGIRLPVGTKITVRVTRAGSIGQAKVLTIRKAKRPQITTRCLPAGSNQIRRRC